MMTVALMGPEEKQHVKAGLQAQMAVKSVIVMVGSQ